MSFTLRPLSEIPALISGDVYASIPSSRKYQLVSQVESAAFELDIVIPVLIAQAANTLEEQFVQDLVIIRSDGGSPAYGPYFVIPMCFQGTLANNVIFGWFQSYADNPFDLTIYSIQLTLQQVDPDAHIKVALVDNYGVIIPDSNYPILGPGASYQGSTLAVPMNVPGNSLIRAMTTDYTPGSEGPKGAGLTCNLITRLR